MCISDSTARQSAGRTGMRSSTKCGGKGLHCAYYVAVVMCLTKSMRDSMDYSR